MKIILNTCTNPYFNLALEEYLLYNTDYEVFMLWRNAPSIIVGRNQNTHAEINSLYVNENKLPVVRRMSGGGAVFHDLGNINFTFIKKKNDNDFNNYALFCAPVIKALASLGVTAELSGRNDLLIDGKKFSGNAQHAHADRIMHHGTLMFDADIQRLTNALNVNPLKIQSKGIKSVRSRVTNISAHLPSPLTAEEFINHLLGCVEGEFHILSDAEIAAAQKLCDEKYSTQDWNYGYKKEFTVKKETLLPQGCFDVEMNIAEGKIKEIRIFGDFFINGDIAVLEEALTYTPYMPDEIAKSLDSVDTAALFPHIDKKTLVSLVI